METWSWKNAHTDHTAIGDRFNCLKIWYLRTGLCDPSRQVVSQWLSRQVLLYTLYHTSGCKINFAAIITGTTFKKVQRRGNKEEIVYQLHTNVVHLIKRSCNFVTSALSYHKFKWIFPLKYSKLKELKRSIWSSFDKSASTEHFTSDKGLDAA